MAGGSLLVRFIHGHVVLVGMVAGGADLRGLGADEGITADQTAPGDRFLSLPYGALLYLAEIAQETAVVVHLDFGDGAEMSGDVGETLLVGYLGKSAIHLVALLLLLLGRKSEIRGGVGDSAGVNTDVDIETAPFEVFKINLGVMEFICGSFTENLPDREILLIVGLLRIESIAGVSHRLSGV